MHDVTTGTYSSGTPDSEWEGLGHFANSANKTVEVNAIMRDVETYAPHGPFGNMKKKEIVILKVLVACSKGIAESTEVLTKYNLAGEFTRTDEKDNEDTHETEHEDIDEPEYREPVVGRTKRVKKEPVGRGPVKAIRKVKTDGQKKGTRRKRANSKDIKVEAQEPAPKKQKTKTKVVPPKVVTAKVVTPRVPKPKNDSATDEKERQYLNRIQILESDQRQLKEEQMKMSVAAALHEKQLVWEHEKGQLNLRLMQETGNTMMFGAAYQRLNNEQLN